MSLQPDLRRAIVGKCKVGSRLRINNEGWNDTNRLTLELATCMYLVYVSHLVP